MGGSPGKDVAGAHPDLFEEVDVVAHESKTHFARSMRTAAVKYEEIVWNPTTEFLERWRWDSIGVSCEPRCGGCRCGNCQPGGKEMTLAEERELEIIKEGLTYVKEDSHSTSPHWDAKYSWTVDPASLPNNKAAVQATFLRTERQLMKDPEWQEAYANQIHEIVE